MDSMGYANLRGNECPPWPLVGVVVSVPNDCPVLDREAAGQYGKHCATLELVNFRRVMSVVERPKCGLLGVLESECKRPRKPAGNRPAMPAIISVIIGKKPPIFAPQETPEPPRAPQRVR